MSKNSFQSIRSHAWLILFLPKLIDWFSSYLESVIAPHRRLISFIYFKKYEYFSPISLQIWVRFVVGVETEKKKKKEKECSFAWYIIGSYMWRESVQTRVLVFILSVSVSVAHILIHMYNVYCIYFFVNDDKWDS